MTFKTFAVPKSQLAVQASLHAPALQLGIQPLQPGRLLDPKQPKNESRIFKAWCGSTYTFARGKDGNLHILPYHDSWQMIRDWIFMERELAKKLRERPDKTEYFARVHANARLEPGSSPTGRLPSQGRMSIHPIPLDWD